MSQDAAGIEIFANLFKAVVDEMAWILLRSSHTTFVKETQDFAVALVTPGGEVFAYPYGSGATPIMGVPMHAGTQAFDDWEPGDVLLTNDPYSTGGMVMHLNDIYLFRPIFVDGAVLCFAWAFIHCTDVGGYAPGSIDMQNNEVFQEGFRLRPFRLYRRGELNSEMWNVFADNCRIPALNWGDLTACTAALAKAEQRMQRLAQRYGAAAVTEAMGGTIDRTERISRDVLARIPRGEYRFTEYFEDDYISDIPVRITVKLISHGDGLVTLDYTGSDPQVRAALNLPAGGMRHHPFLSLGLTNFVVTKSEAIHINAGIQRCIDLVLPEASVVNARFPAACGMRFTTAMRIHDLVVGALSQALPGEVPAGGGNTLVISYISTSELGAAGRVVMRGKDRFRFGSWGVFGGGGGSVCGNTGRRGDAVHDIGKRTVYRPEPGERVLMWSGGGGGFGDPLEREPDAVARDVISGLVSPERAREVYGVVLAGGAVDETATAGCRQALRAGRGALATYDFGPGRSAWERVHRVAAELIADWLPSLPLGVQRDAQARVYRALHEGGPGPYDAATVNAVLAALEGALA